MNFKLAYVLWLCVLCWCSCICIGPFHTECTGVTKSPGWFAHLGHCTARAVDTRRLNALWNEQHCSGNSGLRPGIAVDITDFNTMEWTSPTFCCITSALSFRFFVRPPLKLYNLCSRRLAFNYIRFTCFRTRVENHGRMHSELTRAIGCSI